MTRGFLAGSSWLLHIKQIYIENQERKTRQSYKGYKKAEVDTS